MEHISRRWPIGAILITSAVFLFACQTMQQPARPEAKGRYTALQAIKDERYRLPIEHRKRPEGWELAKADPAVRRVKPSNRQDDPESAWAWFYKHRTDPKGYIPVDYREQAQAYSRLHTRPRLNSVSASWNYVGPTEDPEVVSNGRIVDLAVDPANDQVVYAATAGGGVWKTTDQGANWINLTDNQLPTLGCGSLAMAPGDPNHLLVGLGEGSKGFQNDIDPLGTGIYRTTDGGQSWNLVPGTGAGVMQFVGDLRFVGDANNILAAAWGGYQYQGRGLFRSSDGGQSWQRLIDRSCVSISVDHTNANNVAVSSWELIDTAQGRAVKTSILISTNGGQSFTAATHPDGTNGWRCELARDPQNPNNMLALLGGSDSKIVGLWHSSNGGQSWTARSMSGIPLNDQNFQPSQMVYNNCIALNGGKAYFGSNLRAYRSNDAGGTWAAMTDWDPNDADGLPYIHADHHVITFGANADTIFMGTDGGFFVSSDGGDNWTERNKGLDCTQIYRVSNHPTLEMSLMLGCQDNDKYIRRPDGSWHHWPNTFGDCMEVEVDPNDPEGDGFMGCNYNGSAMRYSPNGGLNWDYWIRTYNRFPAETSVPNGIPENEKGAWVSPFVLDPQNTEYLWVFLQNLYRVRFNPNQVQNWQQMIQTDAQWVPAGTVELLAFSGASTGRQVYAGLNRYDSQQQAYAPAVLRADIGDGTGPIQGTPQELAVPRAGIIGAIACDPSINDTVWLSFTDYGFDKGAVDKGRVYRSMNKGANWEDRTANLPKNLPVSAIFIDPQQSNTIILGTDLGCYRSDDAGASWYEYSQGLPNTVVTDFAFYPPGRMLRAASFGRGLWETNIDGTSVVDILVQPESLTFQTTGDLQSGQLAATGGGLRPLENMPLQNRMLKTLPKPKLPRTPPPKPLAELTILNDSFEGASLGLGWIPYGDPTWGIDDTRTHTGTQSIWCARDGFFGVDPAVSTYPPGIESYIEFGPFSLEGAQAGFVSFAYNMDIDVFDENWFTGDIFTVSVIVYDPFFDSYYFGTYYGSGTAADVFTIDFSDVYFLGDILGQSYVWIQFYFASDWWTQANPSEPDKAGVWIDDVVVRLTDTATPLAAPTGLTATINLTDRVQLNWNTVNGANAYQVYRAQGVNDANQAVAIGDLIAATIYDDVNVGPGTDYYYFVKARNDFTESPFSAGALGRLAEPDPLDPPGGLTASADLWDRIHVTWNAVAEADAYRLRRSAGSDNPAQAQALGDWQAVLTYDDTQVQPGTDYYYYAQARGDGRESPLSAGAMGRLGQTAIADQSFSITNTGQGTLTINAVEREQASDWLQVFPPSPYPIRLEPSQNAVFTVRINPEGLPQGVYQDRLLIRNNAPDKNPYPTGVNIHFDLVGNAVELDRWTEYR